MRFAWSSRHARSAVVTMAMARVRCRGMDVERAVQETLQRGGHCRNPELIAAQTKLRLVKEVTDKLAALDRSAAGMGKARREGKRSAG